MTTTDVSLFGAPVPVPAFLQNNAVAKQLAEQTEGGLSGGLSINRISLKNSKFRFHKEGVEIGISREPSLDVVVLAANPAVARTYYLKKFADGEPGTRPDCYSMDGRTPEADSPAKQSETCALCPQNVKGSAVNSDSKGKACGFGKRIVVAAANAIDGDAYAIDIKAQGLFGDEKPAQRQFNFKSYIEALRTNGLIVPAVVTRMTFDDDSSVPKLLFTPMRPLTAAEWAQVEARVNDPEIRKMLADIDNKTEEGKPAAPALPAPAAAAAAPAAAPPAPAAPAGFPAAPAADAPKPARGRKPATATPPAAAPAPQAPPAPAVGGFGMAPTNGATAPAAAAAPATAPAGFQVDLDGFDD